MDFPGNYKSCLLKSKTIISNKDNSKLRTNPDTVGHFTKSEQKFFLIRYTTNLRYLKSLSFPLNYASYWQKYLQ